MPSHHGQIDSEDDKDSDRTRYRSIVVLGDRSLTQDCIAKFIAAEFADFVIIKLDSIAGARSFEQLNVALVILQVGQSWFQNGMLDAELVGVKKLVSDTPIAILSHHRDDTDPQYMKSNGVNGVIFADEPSDIVIAALRLILAGGTYCSLTSDLALRDPIRMRTGGALDLTGLADAPALVPIKDKDEAPSSSRSTYLHITTRENQVLALLQQGLPNKMIANHLDLSENTVKVHVRRIMQKLKVKNRTEAVLRAQRLDVAPTGGHPDEL